MLLAQEQIPEPQLLRLLFELGKDRNDGLPPLGFVRRQLQVRELRRRLDFILQPKGQQHGSDNQRASATSRNLMSFARVSFAYGENLSSTYTNKDPLNRIYTRGSHYSSQEPSWTVRCILRWDGEPWLK